MEKITVPAKDDQLDKVQEFVKENLAEANLDAKQLFNIDLVIEEVFVNIAHYAYPDGEGDATICCGMQTEPKMAVIEFFDSGVKYDPLEKDDPDIKLDANERQIGGLGIFLTKKLMDSAEYSYENSQNHLILKKNV
jgi:sigma-B regulation protein RsbU (phosphoserine phosphatase)